MMVEAQLVILALVGAFGRPGRMTAGLLIMLIGWACELTFPGAYPALVLITTVLALYVAFDRGSGRADRQEAGA